jgi:hypothetical protein
MICSYGSLDGAITQNFKQVAVVSISQDMPAECLKREKQYSGALGMHV